MAWIESHQELGAHPKTRKLARLLGVSVPAAVGHLHMLWWWAVDYAPDGDIGDVEAEDLAIACMWDGDSDTLLTALRAARFIDDGRYLHDWNDYAGKLIDRRVRNRVRMREARAEHVQSTCLDVRDTERARVQLQDRTVPDQTVPDPEANASVAADDAAAQEPIALEEAQSKRITAAFREQMRTEFPDLDEDAEFDKATNHVSYRKAIDKRRYYRNWLTNARRFAAERGNGNGRGNHRGPGHGNGRRDAAAGGPAAQLDELRSLGILVE